MTIEAAERLGVSARRVRAMIISGRLPAEKKGRDYFIDSKDLKLVKKPQAWQAEEGGKEMMDQGRGVLCLSFVSFRGSAFRTCRLTQVKRSTK